jgi:lactate dehydrogenase-like 2-hydroxyacid dehydrogenase
LAVVAATVDEQLLDLLPDLRLVANYGVGYDGIDVEACARRGCGRDEHARRARGSPTADLTMALVLRDAPAPSSRATGSYGRVGGRPGGTSAS